MCGPMPTYLDLPDVLHLADLPHGVPGSSGMMGAP
jgi:hypothetical protein